MNVFILIGFAIFGYWIVYKLIPSKEPDTNNHSEKTRTWFEVLDLPEDSDKNQIEARYQELIAFYTHDAIAELELELQAEALAYRNEIEAAYHFAIFIKRQQ